jgi:hypothetical protein
MPEHFDVIIIGTGAGGGHSRGRALFERTS